MTNEATDDLSIANLRGVLFCGGLPPLCELKGGHERWRCRILLKISNCWDVRRLIQVKLLRNDLCFAEGLTLIKHLPLKIRHAAQAQGRRISAA